MVMDELVMKVYQKLAEKPTEEWHQAQNKAHSIIHSIQEIFGTEVAVGKAFANPLNIVHHFTPENKANKPVLQTTYILISHPTER